MLSKLLILVVTFNTVLSQLLLKRAVTDIGVPTSLGGALNFLGAAAASPWVYASLVLQVIGYVLWMIVIAREKLGVAIALLGGGFYILMAFAAWRFYGEELSAVQWVGICLVTFGAGCLTVQHT